VKPVRKILVYRLGSLGDTVVALPAIQLVSRAFEEAQLTLLTNKPIATKAAPVESVVGDGVFAEVLDYPIGTRNPLRLAALAAQLRSRKFDLVVNLCEARTRLKTARDRCFFRLSGIRDLRGFPKNGEDFEPAVDPTTGLYESETKRLLRRIATLGSVSLEDPTAWDLRLTDSEKTAGQTVLPSGSNPILALGVGTKMQSKDWEEGNWVALTKQLSQALPGWRLAAVGSVDERRRADGCLAVWSGPKTNLCGTLSPRETAAVLEQATLFIGHDSGPMHLASAVGAPCVAIFSARNLPGQWFPARSGHKIIYHKTDCFGCNLETCITQKKRCILSITVDLVYSAALDLLKERGRLPA